MISASFSSTIRHIILFTFIWGCFSGCSGDHATPQNNASKPDVANDKKISKARLFLTYIDTVAKLPLQKFNEAGIQSINKTFSNQLPLVMYNPSKDDNKQNIVVQWYKNEDAANKTKSGAIFLVPKHITDSLSIADFTNYFGNIKKVKPLIGITAQPLPVQIDISANISIKLTFNDDEKIEQAKVITVEVLKHN